LITVEFAIDPSYCRRPIPIFALGLSFLLKTSGVDGAGLQGERYPLCHPFSKYPFSHDAPLTVFLQTHWERRIRLILSSALRRPAWDSLFSSNFHSLLSSLRRFVFHNIFSVTATYPFLIRVVVDGRLRE